MTVVSYSSASKATWRVSIFEVDGEHVAHEYSLRFAVHRFLCLGKVFCVHVCVGRHKMVSFRRRFCLLAPLFKLVGERDTNSLDNRTTLTNIGLGMLFVASSVKGIYT